jgi:hypothetical protein
MQPYKKISRRRTGDNSIPISKNRLPPGLLGAAALRLLDAVPASSAPHAASQSR